MTQKHAWIIASLLAACLPLAGCAKNEKAEEALESPAKIERPNGEDAPAKITLDKEAAERIDLKTATIEEIEAKGAKLKTMPYSALLYDKEGETWAYAIPAEDTYTREKLKVDRI